jgi:DNA-directed RNA polymerase subunit RPC12/RpoP
MAKDRRIEKLVCGLCGKEFIESDYKALGRMKTKYTPACSHKHAKKLRKKGIRAVNMA